jgi:nucleotide-binding universal stress UspA family protein
MYKTILVPVSGSPTDEVVFATALALARPFGAHLRFLHVRLTPATAALAVPQFAFSRGTAISHELERLRALMEELAASARRHVEAFCETSGLGFRDSRSPDGAVSASWFEELDQPRERFLLHARHSDLVVFGRRASRDHLPTGLLEDILVDSGRPIVIAHAPPPRRFGAIALGWKETAEAARALAAALPLLRQAENVYLLGIATKKSPSRAAFEDLARQLTWHGIDARITLASETSRPAATELVQLAADSNADLLVLGGYGHARSRELVFGGVTQAVIDDAALPVFLAH